MIKFLSEIKLLRSCNMRAIIISIIVIIASAFVLFTMKHLFHDLDHEMAIRRAESQHVKTYNHTANGGYVYINDRGK